MTTDEIIAAARRVSFENPPFPVQCTIEVPAWMTGQVAVITIIHVSDRDTGHPRRVTFQMMVGLEIFEDEDDVWRVMFDVVRNAFVHELDECWRVDGVRARDPHG